MPVNEICYMNATELARRIKSGELSAKEVMEAHLSRIELVNPKVNAIVTFLPDEAIKGAEAADAALA